jgi:acetyl-CoA carboxylase alpha subunit
MGKRLAGPIVPHVTQWQSVAIAFPVPSRQLCLCGEEPLAILSSSIDKNAADFRVNAERMRALVSELQARRAEAALGGSERSRERHVSRGKLLPRDRVMTLIDPGSPFLELSPLAANGMYDDAIHGAGLITGIGRIEGRECLVVCNDSTIKGGTYFPMTVKKHLRAQEIARENRLPCVYLVDSGGANLPHQTEVFPDREHFGRIPRSLSSWDHVLQAAPMFRQCRTRQLSSKIRARSFSAGRRW